MQPSASMGQPEEYLFVLDVSPALPLRGFVHYYYHYHHYYYYYYYYQFFIHVIPSATLKYKQFNTGLCT